MKINCLNHTHIAWCAHTSEPATQCIHGMPGITYGRAFHAGQISMTINHLRALNVDFANQNVLKRILIAMLNENNADWDENFRICAEEPIAPLYKK